MKGFYGQLNQLKYEYIVLFILLFLLLNFWINDLNERDVKVHIVPHPLWHVSTLVFLTVMLKNRSCIAQLSAYATYELQFSTFIAKMRIFTNCRSDAVVL